MANKKLKGLFFVLLSLFLFSCSDSEFSSTNCEGGTCEEVVSKSSDWDIGEWSRCSRACGGGIKTRSVICKNGNDVEVPDSECGGTKPETQESCGTNECSADYEWNVGDWGFCSQPCGGTRARTVTCQSSSSGAFVEDGQCTETKPITSEDCPNSCPPESYQWVPGDWDKACACGIDEIKRTVDCKSTVSGAVELESFCKAEDKPADTQTCPQDTCTNTYSWVEGAWSDCTKTCGGGTQARSLGCMRNDGVYVPHTLCDQTIKPELQRDCNTQACKAACNKKTFSTSVAPSDNQVDVLLVIDDSGSMYKDTSRLAPKLAGFVDQLDGSNIDWQMCITTTDTEYFQGRPIQWGTGFGSGFTPINHILRRSTGNLNAIFIDTMRWIGAGFSSDEQGIKAMNLAIKDNSRSKCFRDKAALQVIVISDEDERSVGGNYSISPNDYKPLGPLNTPESFINTVREEFSPGKKVIVNSIVVKDATCKAQQEAQGERSFYGNSYINLSHRTNGNTESICAPDYSNCLGLFYQNVKMTLGSVNLQCNPDPLNNVKVNGSDYKPYVTVSGDKLIFNPVVEGPATVTGEYCCK